LLEFEHITGGRVLVVEPR